MSYALRTGSELARYEVERGLGQDHYDRVSLLGDRASVDNFIGQITSALRYFSYANRAGDIDTAEDTLDRVAELLNIMSERLSQSEPLNRPTIRRRQYPADWESAY